MSFMSNFLERLISMTIYDQDRLSEYADRIIAKRQVTERTATRCARMILRAEKEGLTTEDDVYDKYWGLPYEQSRLRQAIRLQREMQ